MLKQLGISEPFPFCHGLRRDTFPVNGDSFWVVLAQCQKAPRPGSWQTEGLTEGLRQAKRNELLFNPSGSLRSPPSLSGQA